MTNEPISPESAFAIDFNLHWVPAALGLDVPPAAAARMLDLTEAQFVAYTEQVRAEVERTATKMLATPDIVAGVDRLSVPEGGTMMSIGDSITTYRQSYARLLESMVASRPGETIYLNVAQSGYTSTHGMENVFTQFLAHQPDWVSIMFGANDCKRFGTPHAKTLVSFEEYCANMAAMLEAFLRHSSARPVLLTPAPVVEDVVNDNPDFQAMQMTWSNADIIARAEAVKELAVRHGVPVVDLVGVFGESPDPDLYVDGLHPGPAGHQLILTALLGVL